MTETNWRDMPRSVTESFCPRDHFITTPTERRMLWHLEGVLTVSATNDTLRGVARNLRAYLTETCEHHWHEYRAEGDIPAHRQCLWCCDVDWLDRDRSAR